MAAKQVFTRIGVKLGVGTDGRPIFSYLVHSIKLSIKIIQLHTQEPR